MIALGTRKAPADACSLSGDSDVLKGTRFNSFGAFFSRAYRENDYLWGRLHGAERMIDILVSTVAPATLSPADIAKAKARAFAAILDEESGRPTQIAPLIERLRTRLAGEKLCKKHPT